jgi:hypothetical protein
MTPPRPTRYGYVLRRLADGKTSAINYRVARELARGALVTLLEPESRASTLRVAITDAGRAAALASKRGESVAVRLKR